MDLRFGIVVLFLDVGDLLFFFLGDFDFLGDPPRGGFDLSVLPKLNGFDFETSEGLPSVEFTLGTDD